MWRGNEKDMVGWLTKRRFYDERGRLDCERCDGVEDGELMVDWKRMWRFVRG